MGDVDTRPAAVVDAGVAEAAPASTAAAVANPSEPYLREAQTFPRLTGEQVGRAEAFGTAPDGGERVITIHGARQFTGELDLFNDRLILVGDRVGAEGGRVVRVSRAVPRRVVRLDCSARPYALHLDDGSAVRARAVVVATGASYRTLDLPGFDRFSGGNGVHWAATAIEAGLCEREEVAVVGGGNSAGQAAVFLSRVAAHVHVLVRGPDLAASMSDYLVGRIAASDRITLHTETEVTALIGGRHLEAVEWTNRRTGAVARRAVHNVFLMLGAVPNTGWLGGCGVARDAQGFVQVGAEAGADPADPLWSGRRPHVLETSRPGIFAVGDVRAGSVKRVASAVGEGSVVVSSVHQVLAEG